LAMTFPETLNIKVAINELSFLLVSHVAEVLKTFWRDCRPVNDQVLRAEDARILVRVVYKFRRPLTQLSNIYSHAGGYNRLNTATCGVQRIAVKWNRKRFRFSFRQRRDYNL
jgi:hypothetical protein